MKFGEVMKKKLHSFPSTGDTPGRERGCAAGARGTAGPAGLEMKNVEFIAYCTSKTLQMLYFSDTL